jgi:hypothetical protein
MRERGQAIGAKFDVWGRPGAGTEIELILLSTFAHAQIVRRFRWMGARLLKGE